MGVTQGAVHQMILKKRDLYIVLNDAGLFLRAFEVKPVGTSNDDVSFSDFASLLTTDLQG